MQTCSTVVIVVAPAAQVAIPEGDDRFVFNGAAGFWRTRYVATSVVSSLQPKQGYVTRATLPWHALYYPRRPSTRPSPLYIGYLRNIGACAMVATLDQRSSVEVSVSQEREARIPLVLFSTALFPRTGAPCSFSTALHFPSTCAPFYFSSVAFYWLHVVLSLSACARFFCWYSVQSYRLHVVLLL